MTNHSLINASGKTHAKIAFLALAVSAVFVTLISASVATKADTSTVRVVVKANAVTKVATGGASVIR
jgi:hypothetical protein